MQPPSMPTPLIVSPTVFNNSISPPLSQEWLADELASPSPHPAKRHMQCRGIADLEAALDQLKVEHAADTRMFSAWLSDINRRLVRLEQECGAASPSPPDNK